jgi:hypothetical protein
MESRSLSLILFICLLFSCGSIDIMTSGGQADLRLHRGLAYKQPEPSQVDT